MEKHSPKPRRYLVRNGEWKADKGIRICHVLNKESDVYWVPLSEKVGMKRAHLSIGRIPPGKESFAFHAHTLQEEFLFILSGSGEAEIGENVFEVGPGDYMGFPTDGTGHHLRNTGAEELVYLMGGERTAAEISYFPRLGKRIMLSEGAITVYDDQEGRRYTIQEWIGNPDIDNGTD